MDLRAFKIKDVGQDTIEGVASEWGGRMRNLERSLNRAASAFDSAGAAFDRVMIVPEPVDNGY
jgi:hypothetical protein